ncbi:uncharacterized protein LOC103146752 [Poecilia formosa]|uniref:uncharacterized protein LOC103146752 n=1 Tax=Poecilia formosa TaxID=48698 RepID=UPI0007BA036F|nr:PREDICTED: uncharacterized protein LOC103146752 [Poecilia formosa]
METCDKTDWIFSGQSNKRAEPLFERGKIHKDARTKSDRLSVTSNCSLVIKKISVEDVGLYTCRQFETSGEKVAESVADLSVVNMTEQKISDETILICSVSSYGGGCSHSVKWLYDNKDDENIKTITPPQSACSATVSFTTSHVSTSKRSELFRCLVKYGGDMKEFSFRISPQREKTGTIQATKVMTTFSTTWKTTITTTKALPAATTTTTTTNMAAAQSTITISIKRKTGSDSSNSNGGLKLRFLVVFTGLAALLAAVVAVNIWTKVKVADLTTYHIWDGRVPLSMAGSVNQLWDICCLTPNCHGPLDLKEDKPLVYISMDQKDREARRKELQDKKLRTATRMRKSP